MNISPTVRLTPIERIPTTYAYTATRKKLKKRKERKRSSNTSYKTVKRQTSFVCNSDFESVVDYSKVSPLFSLESLPYQVIIKKLSFLNLLSNLQLSIDCTE